MYICESAMFKSGGSKAIRIPKELLFSGGINDVVMSGDGTKIIIKPKKKKSLANFLKKYKELKVDAQDFLLDREDVPPIEKELF